MLNYEYVLESIGRLYKIQGIFLDDLVWTVIENGEFPLRYGKEPNLSEDRKARTSGEK